MEKTKKSNERKGFITVSLVVSGDMTLYNRVEEEAGADPEMDKSKLVRAALKEYFERKDSQK